MRQAQHKWYQGWPRIPTRLWGLTICVQIQCIIETLTQITLTKHRHHKHEFSQWMSVHVGKKVRCMESVPVANGSYWCGMSRLTMEHSNRFLSGNHGSIVFVSIGDVKTIEIPIELIGMSIELKQRMCNDVWWYQDSNVFEFVWKILVTTRWYTFWCHSRHVSELEPVYVEIQA